MTRINGIETHSYRELKVSHGKFLENVNARCKYLAGKGFTFLINKSNTLDASLKWAATDPKRIRQMTMDGAQYTLWAVRA